MIQLEPTAAPDETTLLRRTVRDLAALAALPAIWIAPDLRRSLQNVTEALCAALRAQFVYIRAKSGSDAWHDAAATCSVRSQCAVADQIRAHLGRHVDLLEPDLPATIPALDDGPPLRLVCAHVAMEGSIRGVLIACSPGEKFGTTYDRLLLQTGATQVAILLQRHELEARREFQTRRLEATEARSTQLMQMLPAGVCVCDAAGNVTFFNQRALELLRGEPRAHETWAEFAARYRITWADTHVSPPAPTPMLLALREGRAFRNVELRIVRPDGTEFCATCNIEPLRAPDGSLNGVINVFHDVTERKRQETHAAVLARLSEELAGSEDEASLVAATTRALGQHLRAHRCYFSEYDWAARRVVVGRNWQRDPSVPDLAGEYDLDEFTRPDRVERAAIAQTIVPDVTTHPLTCERATLFLERGIGAIASAPFMRDGKRVAALTLTDAAPRTWDPDEVALLENVVARLWPMIERVRAIAALRASEERFRMIADNIAAFAWTANGEGGRTWFNRRWYDYTGTTLEQVQGYGWESVHHPDHLPRVKARWQESLRRGEPWEDTFPLRGKDGRYRWFLTRAVPIRDEQQRVLRWFGTNIDVTELRQAHEELALRSRSLEALNRAGAALVAERDLERLVQGVTDAGREITGAAFGAFFYNTVNERGESYSLYTLSGAPREAFAKFPMPRNTPLFGPTFRGEGVVRIGNVKHDPRYGRNEPHHGLPPGHLPVCSYLAVPVITRAGEVVGGLFYGHPQPDVFTAEAESTLVNLAAQAAIAIENANLYRALERELERKRHAEAELRAAQKQLESHAADLEKNVAERTKSLRDAIAQMEEFSYSVSHDLRAPVRAMRGYAQVLLQDYRDRLGIEGVELLRRIELNGTRMDRLIQDLLTYTRVSRRELRFEPVHLDRLIRDIVQQYPDLQAPRAAVIVEDPMPAVLAHEPSLTQVASNLLSNAVKFVHPGTAPRIRIWAERRPEGVRVWFEDNGIGIDPRHHGRLFGLFERMHPEQPYDGTGIGLAIVRKAIERMNGRVGVESDGVTGSSFWIELPAVAPA